jgi:hypothetical protein
MFRTAREVRGKGLPCRYSKVLLEVSNTALNTPGPNLQARQAAGTDEEAV